MSLQPVQVATGSNDTESQLVFADDFLVAVLVRLSDDHGAEAGMWFLEVGFGRVDDPRRACRKVFPRVVCKRVALHRTCLGTTRDGPLIAWKPKFTTRRWAVLRSRIPPGARSSRRHLRPARISEQAVGGTSSQPLKARAGTSCGEVDFAHQANRMF